jgi:hypothetical protein
MAEMNGPADDEDTDEIVTYIDATKIVDPKNADESLGFFMHYAEPGDVVTLHSEWCRTHLGDWACTCTPRSMIVGAKA